MSISETNHPADLQNATGNGKHVAIVSRWPRATRLAIWSRQTACATNQPIKVGLLAGGFFEYWRMYPETLKSAVESDAEVVFQRLARDHHVVYPGLVDTMDSADEAGRRFRDEQIDLLILTERTYVPDTYIHQLLSHIPGVPLLLFVSQTHDKIDLEENYEATLARQRHDVDRAACGRLSQDGHV